MKKEILKKGTIYTGKNKLITFFQIALKETLFRKNVWETV